jgi:small-conductance mechanosensitive channel
VFLNGQTATEDQSDWAQRLVAKTDGVVAVVNQLEVKKVVNWSIDPALNELRRLADGVIVAGPLILLSLLILPLAWISAGFVAKFMRWSLQNKVESPFLRDVFARAVAFPVFLIGLYVVLQVAGLTQLALSLLGGAGVLGVVIGFAFRDIAENFLASLLLSIRRPFRSGDLITVAGETGTVQSMNTRSTVLITPEGNHIQIPNSVIFKSIIENQTAAPYIRDSFVVGIGYDDAIADAQDIILKVLEAHTAVVTDPPPMALTDELGASTVDIKAYYWFNGEVISAIKLRSALLRQTKRALTEAGVSMPDAAREVIFPQGVPVRQMDAEPPAPKKTVDIATRRPLDRDEPEVCESENDLSVDRDLLQRQTTSVVEEGEENLLSR